MTITLLHQIPQPSSPTRHVQKDTSLVITPPLIGHAGPIVGDLSICEDQLYFYSTSAQSGIAVEYPDIIIHAIARRQEPHIYCQLDSGLFLPNQQLPEDQEEREECITELTFIPKDSGTLDAIYMAMTECAELHPDSEFMAEQEDSEEEYYADPSSETELNELQQAALRHLESVFVPNGSKQDKYEDTMEQ
ncbi:regulator of volume decrease after cellular swelling-domain-containing protein [Pilobolus umbonatus]|nr:regulator of volume decrease after cellular swelling-domain-containing protein [Pilobolus umbonatus]